MNNDLKEIAEHFGARKQLAKVIEECGELIEAANIYHDDLTIDSDPLQAGIDRLHVIEEMADVQILIDQLTHLLYAKDELEQMRVFKIVRTKKRIEDKFYA